MGLLAQMLPDRDGGEVVWFIVAVHDGGQHRQGVLGGPVEVGAFRASADHVCPVLLDAPSERHIQRVAAGPRGDDGMGDCSGSALGGVHGAGVFQLHMSGHVASIEAQLVLDQDLIGVGVDPGHVQCPAGLDRGDLPDVAVGHEPCTGTVGPVVPAGHLSAVTEFPR